MRSGSLYLCSFKHTYNYKPLLLQQKWLGNTLPLFERAVWRYSNCSVQVRMIHCWFFVDSLLILRWFFVDSSLILCWFNRFFMSLLNPAYEWGLRALVDQPGWLEFLLDRRTETTKLGAEWKYDIIKVWWLLLLFVVCCYCLLFVVFCCLLLKHQLNLNFEQAIVAHPAFASGLIGLELQNG